MSYNGVMIIGSMGEPTTFESAQARRKEMREWEKQRRENFRTANYRGYENLTSLRGAWRKTHGL